eukprot:960864-Prymnesium_polylepis.1
MRTRKARGPGISQGQQQVVPQVVPTYSSRSPRTHAACTASARCSWARHDGAASAGNAKEVPLAAHPGLLATSLGRLVGARRPREEPQGQLAGQ